MLASAAEIRCAQPNIHAKHRFRSVTGRDVTYTVLSIKYS